MREDFLLPAEQSEALFASVVRQRGGERIRARELEVLYHRVARGLSIQEVAGELVISPRTVEAHLAAVRLRLGFGSQEVMRDELFRAFARAEARAEVG